MVGTAALVTGSSTVVLHTIVSSSEASSTTSWSDTASICRWTVSCQMADLTATVAATPLRTTNAQSWAVSLDVTEPLTVIALLG